MPLFAAMITRFNKNHLLILLLILPFLVLIGLSFKSIRESSIVIEKEYLEVLNQVGEGISEQNQKTIQKVLAQTQLLALNKAQLGTSLTRLSRSTIQSLIPGLEGLSISKESQLVYPKLNHTKHASSKYLSNAFEDSLLHLQHRTDLRQNILTLRKRKNLTLKLRSQERHLNELGIIKLLFQEKKYRSALSWMKKNEKKITQRWLELNLIKVKSQVRLGKYNLAYQTAYKTFSKIFDHGQPVDLYQASYVINEMYNELLGNEDLNEEDRKNLFTINENVNNTFSDAIVQLESQHVFAELLLGTSRNNSRSWVSENHFYLVQKVVITSDTLEISSRWNLEILNSWYLRELDLNRPTWRDEAFQLTRRNQPVFEHALNPSYVIHQEISLGENSPFEGLRVFRPQERELASMIQNRSWFLYGILIMSILLIVTGAIFVIRSTSKEKKLLQLKSNFLSSVTHELKTPLTSIKMFSEMMFHGRIKTPEKSQEYGALIHKETSRLQLMVDDILNYSKMEQGEEELLVSLVPLHSLFESIQKRIEPIASQRQIDIQFHAEPDLIVEGDNVKLESLFQNLIDNAIKYSPNQTQVIIRTEHDNQSVRVEVVDEGIGIAKQEIASIFDLFYRVGDEMTRKTKGSGLGLAIAQRIAKLHQTKIQVQSELNHGSTFSIKLKRINYE